MELENENIYFKLRNQALSLSKISSELEPNKAGVYAVIMEMGYPGITATLVVVSDGMASLYLSNERIIIGAGNHKSVNTIVNAFMNTIGNEFMNFQAMENPPMPAEGLTHFYFVTNKGTFVAAAVTEDLEHPDHILNSYNSICHRIFSEITKIADSKEKGS